MRKTFFYKGKETKLQVGDEVILHFDDGLVLVGFHREGERLLCDGDRTDKILLSAGAKVFTPVVFVGGFVLLFYQLTGLRLQKHPQSRSYPDVENYIVS